MTKEALKLALEALQNPWKAGPDGVADAIIAIKEALAQPEQEPFMASYEFKQYGYYKDEKGILKLGNIQAAQPPQRTWVGLTKEERHEISMANRPYCADIMAAHEEELKRRNT